MIRLNPSDYLGYYGEAWLRATCPKEQLRDGKKAVEYATKACELTSWNSSPCLEALAAAYAEAGDFTQAVKWQKKVVDSNPQGKQPMEIARQRLALYEEKKPYRSEN